MPWNTSKFDDPDLKCNFYNYCISTGNTKNIPKDAKNLAWVEWQLGDYSAAQMHANEAQRLAIISADLYREAQALDIEAICCHTLGNYTKAMSLSSRARELLGLCGMSMGLDHTFMNSQAEIHRHKSESLPEGGKFIGSQDYFKRKCPGATQKQLGLSGRAQCTSWDFRGTEDDLSDIEDLDKMDMGDEKSLV
ncbi:hypothetical protein B0H13DRAFT_1910050 [Mycena leptocephala]|nr:hypothetical protein B0H13DRAFT_1910050 [Mycena leptocephala]